VKGIDYIPELLRNRGYLIMEKILGVSILSTVLDLEPIEEKKASEYLKQILEAVDYMHLKGVIHRDMNPTNVFIQDSGSIKILDFNVSKLLTEK
jgi:serine/threonine protein kinase